MPKISNSINISAPVEKVFGYVSDPMSALEWFVGMTEVKDVTGSGVGQHYQWKYTMIGVPLQGETTVIEHVPNERLVSEGKGGIPSTFTFTFAPHEVGTRLDMEIDYTIPVPVLGKLAEKLVFKRNQREAAMSMENIKERLET
ncbi:MAG: SRPBCC family protein [Myxococcales bacterium]|nr:SRPBCC family protein [Myxococcales bacterium]